MLEAQQQAIDARPGQPLHNLNIDAGSLWSRRSIERIIESESTRETALPR